MKIHKYLIRIKYLNFYDLFIFFYLVVKLGNLVAVGGTSHTTHYTEDVVVNSVYTDLGGVGARYSAGRKDKLKDSVVNSGEVAAARGLVFLRAYGKGVYVDTSLGVTGVVLVGLNNIEVRTLTLREAVLAVEL